MSHARRTSPLELLKRRKRGLPTPTSTQAPTPAPASTLAVAPKPADGPIPSPGRETHVHLSITPRKPEQPRDPEADHFEAILGWLPDDCRRDAFFLNWAKRVVTENAPQGAIEEAAVARIIEGMWRLRQDMKSNEPARDAKRRATAERELARAEQSWARLRRLSEWQRRAEQRAARDAARTQPAATEIEPEPDPTSEPNCEPAATLKTQAQGASDHPANTVASVAPMPSNPIEQPQPAQAEPPDLRSTKPALAAASLMLSSA